MRCIFPLLVIFFFVAVFANEEEYAKESAIATKDYFCNDTSNVLQSNKEELDECFEDKASSDEVFTLMKDCYTGLELPLTVDACKKWHCESSWETVSTGLMCETDRYPLYVYEDKVWGLRSAIQVCLESIGIGDMGLPN